MNENSLSKNYNSQKDENNDKINSKVPEEIDKLISLFSSNSNYIEYDNNNQYDYVWPFPFVRCEVNSKLELRQAENYGYGVYAKEDIKQDEYLCCYIGRISHLIEEFSDYTFNLTLPNNLYSVTIDSKNYGNISRFVNHSYNPNCYTQTEYHTENCCKNNNVKIYVPGNYWQYKNSEEKEGSIYYFRNNHESVWDKPQQHIVRWPIKGREEPHICFRAKADIKKDEQIFINYGESYWKSRNIVPI